MGISLVDFSLSTHKSEGNEEKCKLLLSILSPHQRRFVLSPHRFKIARCGRRSGKTWGVANYLIYECLRNPNTPTLYAGLTRDSAKAAVWDILVAMLEELHIPHEISLSTLTITFPNGSKITLFGCDAQNARNRLRSRKFKLIVFDETGFFVALDPLVYAVLPMLADYGGTLVFASSPGVLLQGVFYEADQGKRKEFWDHYTWTIHDNPHFQKAAFDSKYATRADEELAIMLETQYDGDVNHPEYRREWLGQWVSDSTSLVYPLTAANIVRPYAMGHQEHAFGINIGHPFVNSILVGRYSAYSRHLQIIDEIDVEDKPLDVFAKLLEEARGKYDPNMIVAHVGSYRKEVGDDFRKRYSLPIQVLEDKDTSFHQRTMASDIAAGYVQVNPACLQLVAQCGKLVRDAKGEEIEGQENYAASVALALHRKIYTTSLSTFEKPLTVEERHIKQLEDAHGGEESAWYDR